VVNVHALVATCVNADGYREILGLDVLFAEDVAGWLASSAGWRPAACPGRPGHHPRRAHRLVTPTEAAARRLVADVRNPQRSQHDGRDPEDQLVWVKAMPYSIFDRPALRPWPCKSTSSSPR
jgi:putative transposase